MSFKVIIGEDIQKNLSIPQVEFVCCTVACLPYSTTSPSIVTPPGAERLGIGDFQEALSSSSEMPHFTDKKARARRQGHVVSF